MSGSDQDKSDQYLEKAERIDMSFCTTLKRDKETIENYQRKNRR